jgi:hypothetical protein
MARRVAPGSEGVADEESTSQTTLPPLERAADAGPATKGAANAPRKATAKKATAKKATAKRPTAKKPAVKRARVSVNADPTPPEQRTETEGGTAQSAVDDRPDTVEAILDRAPPPSDAIRRVQFIVDNASRQRDPAIRRRLFDEAVSATAQIEDAGARALALGQIVQLIDGPDEMSAFASVAASLVNPELLEQLLLDPRLQSELKPQLYNDAVDAAADQLPVAEAEDFALKISQGLPTDLRDLVLGEAASRSASPTPSEAPTEWVAGYSADSAEGKVDSLGFHSDVNVVSALLASRKVDPPLSVGLFGDWGTGKSFFMRQMRDRVDWLSAQARESENTSLLFYKNVKQIWFNAWHYVDANLWASLAARIFEGLADSEQARQRLFQGSEWWRAQLSEAESRESVLTEEETALDSQLGQLNAELTRLETQAQKSEGVDLSDIRKAVAASPDVQGAMKSLQEKLENEGVDIEQVRALISPVRTGWNRLSRVWRLVSSKERRNQRLVVAGAVLLVVAAAVVGGVLVPKRLGTLRWLIPVAAVVTSTATTVGRWVRRADHYLEMFETTAATIEREEERQRLTREEVLLAQQRLQEALARKETLELQRVEARRRAGEARAELDDIRSGRRLAKFVRERASSQDYRQHLGLIALIHRDFQRLLDILHDTQGEAAQSPQAKPGGDGPGQTGNEGVAAAALGEGESALVGPDTTASDGDEALLFDRIILYIDDLDRCPPDRVVDVLQAVHLLLALPLFVVVVGVDSRWLVRSLEHHYAEILESSAEDRGDTDHHWQTTPLNYLEKIFQIPITLPRMDPDGYRQLVGDLFRPQPESPTDDDARRRREERTGQGGIGGQGLAALATAMPDEVGEEGRLGQGRGQDADAGGASAEDERQARINARALVLEEWEVESLEELGELIDTPRSAKRLVNIYRLVRASVSDEKYASFLGTREAPGEFRAVMVLLGILVGFPEMADRVFVAMMSYAETWVRFVTQLDPPSPGANLTQVAPDEKAGFSRLAAGLDKAGVRLRLGDDFSVFREWIPEVARYSFRPGRILSGQG